MPSIPITDSTALVTSGSPVGGVLGINATFSPTTQVQPAMARVVNPNTQALTDVNSGAAGDGVTASAIGGTVQTASPSIVSNANAPSAAI